MADKLEVLTDIVTFISKKASLVTMLAYFSRATRQDESKVGPFAFPPTYVTN